MSNIKEDTISGVKWNAIGNFSAQGVQFIIGIVLARLLQPSDYGTIGMLTIFISLARTFVDSGFSNALIRKIDRTEVDFSTVFYFNIIIGVISYLLLCVCAPFIAKFFHTPVLNELIHVVGLCIILNSLCVVQTAKLTIKIDFRTQAIISLLSGTLSGLIGIVMAYSGWGVWALAWSQVLAAGFNLLLLWISTKWKPSLVFSMDSFQSMFSFGGKLLVSGLIHTIYQNISTAFIGRFYTSNDLGLYSRGQHLAQLPSTNFNAIVQRVTFPILSKIQNDEERLLQIYRHYICVTSLVIFFCMTLLIALSEPLVTLILGVKWQGAVVFLRLFSLAYMFDHICSINVNLLYVKGRSDLVLKLEVIKKTIAMLLLAASVPFGVMWICVSQVLYMQIAIIINCSCIGKYYKMGYIEQLRDFMPFLLCSVISCLPTYLLSIAGLPIIITIISGCILSTFLYWLILRNNSHMVEIMGLVIAYIKKVTKK